jgi:SAM-dependent methyltransferase
VGCGAGLTTVAVAERGYAVETVDTVRDMLLTTKACAVRTAVAHRIRVIQASADHLPYGDNQFSLLLAIGVLPWLACIRKAMMEFIRVTRPGGCLVVTGASENDDYLARGCGLESGPHALGRPLYLLEREVAFCRTSCSVQPPEGADVVISNTYPNDVSLTFGRMKGMVPLHAWALPRATRIAVAACTEGIGRHNLFHLLLAPTRCGSELLLDALP